MRPFWSAHLSNLIHVFRWRCILPFVGVIADLRFLTSVPESGRAYLPPTQLGCLLIYTPSVPYCTIHSVALSLYPTRYLAGKTEVRLRPAETTAGSQIRQTAWQKDWEDGGRTISFEQLRKNSWPHTRWVPRGACGVQRSTAKISLPKENVNRQVA